MPFRTQLPAITKFTFGTGNIGDAANPDHLKCARTAMDAGVWFHSSHAYGNGGAFQTLKKAFAEAPGKIPKCIFKVDGLGADLLRETVEASLATGVARVDIAQLCGNPDFAELQPGRPLHDTMVELIRQGKVGGFCLEIFWRYSPNAIRSVQHDLFDSYTYYYNPVNREVSNDLYDLMQQKQVPILALRTLGGGVDSVWGTPDPEAARAALDALYVQSGCGSKLEFRTRFIFSIPNVRTTIGATANPAHLAALLAATADPQPLKAEIVEQIRALHRRWFAEKGIG